MNIDESKYKNLFSWNFLVILIAVGLILYLNSKGYDRNIIFLVLVIAFILSIFLRKKKNK